MSNKQKKIIFFGTPEFAAVILQSLIKTGFKPIAVVTAPDKPIGRKQILTPCQVKKVALTHNIDVFQPASLKNNPDIINQLSQLNPDVFIVAAYGLILPKEILQIPQYGGLNIHPSLLPKHRGATPIQATILHGDTVSGVSIIVMDEKVDHGDIIVQKSINIKHETYESLSKQLAKLGANLLIKTLPKWLKNEINLIAQDHSKATFTKRIKKQDGKIDWTKSGENIEAMTRAYYPWPGAYATIQLKQSNIHNKVLKIIKADVLKIEHKKKPGTIFLTENKKLAVACRKNVLILQNIQLQGKRSITAQDLLNGYPNITNAVLI